MRFNDKTNKDIELLVSQNRRPVLIFHNNYGLFDLEFCARVIATYVIAYNTSNSSFFIDVILKIITVKQPYLFN